MGTNIRIKERYNFQLWLAGGVLLVGFLVAYTITVSAQADLSQIQYPVAELGNCGNEEECRSFCNDGDNLLACVSFAERNGLMSDEEAAEARKFANLGGRGPGGCTDKIQCIEYCEDIDHINECVAFAERHGFIDEEELAEAKKVAAALEGGATLPGGCKNKAQCEVYCDDLDHINECLDFAEASGFLSEEELAEARQAARAMESGARPPGGCKNKNSCEDYCSDPNNVEECFAFAERAGFIPEEELEMARKMIPLMKAGKMPGGCRSKEACEAYCEDEANLESCANFAIEAGLMAPEEAEMFRKTGGKGPGGCRGRDGCEDFCNDPANQEACFSFASEHGLIPPEELEQIQEGFQQFRQSIESAPEEVTDCLRSSLGSDTFDKLQAGQGMPGREMGNVMRSCFEDFARSQFEGAGGEGFGPGGFDGEHKGGFGPPPGFEGEFDEGDFERFREEGGFPGDGPSPNSGSSSGFPGGEGGGFPSEEEIEKFQRGEFNQGGFEGGRGPSPEELERFSGGEGFEGGVPSQKDLQNIIQQKTQEQFQQQFQQEFQSQIPSGGSPSPSSGSGDFQQFSPPPSGGGTTAPPPTSSALDTILAPFVNFLR
ncbi:MAG: hypothetical protein WAP55_02885 [Minisyncoccia bacterium]